MVQVAWVWQIQTISLKSFRGVDETSGVSTNSSTFSFMHAGSHSSRYPDTYETCASACEEVLVGERNSHQDCLTWLKSGLWRGDLFLTLGQMVAIRWMFLDLPPGVATFWLLSTTTLHPDRIH